MPAMMCAQRKICWMKPILAHPLQKFALRPGADT
jgi:hypothetical protein